MPAVAPLRERMHSLEEDLSSSKSLRILVAGDAAVGKSRLCELICSGSCSHAPGEVSALPGESPVSQQEWTLGCCLSITREAVDVDFRTVEVEAELWEVGGTKTYSCARPVFYDDLDAVVLVYDVSNMKSYDSLVAWLFELCVSVKPPSLTYWDTGGGSGGVPDMDLELGDSGVLQQGILSGHRPVLFVANKCDLQDQRWRGELARHLPRPQPPQKPPLIDRLLGGSGGDSFLQTGRRSAADAQLMGRLCDFVLQGRHTEACCKDGQLHFDFNLWRDFVRQTYKAKQNVRER